MSRRLVWMSGSGWEVPDIRECSDDLQYVRYLSVGPPECLGVVGRPTRKSGSGREAIPDVCEWSGGPPRYPGVVERLSRMSRSGCEALQDFREWSGGPSGCLGVVGRPTRMSKCG